MKKNRRDSGFTLIEILIVVTLLAVTSLVITTSLVQGVRIFKRFNGVSDAEEKMFFTERLTADLQNGCSYSQVPWKISGDSISFPSIPAAPEEGPTAGLPHRVSYSFNPDKKVIIRTESIFPYDEESTKMQVVASGILAARFEAARESEESMPRRLTASFDYGSASSPETLKKTILIPAGYRGTK